MRFLESKTRIYESLFWLFDIIKATLFLILTLKAYKVPIVRATEERLAAYLNGYLSSHSVLELQT